MTLRQELVGACAFNTSCFSGLFVDVRVEIVVMDVFRNVLAMSSILLDIETSVGDVVPSSLRFVSEENIGTIVPLEPSPHALG